MDDELELEGLQGDDLREALEVEHLLRELFPPSSKSSWWDDVGNVDEMKRKLKREGLT